MLFLLAAGQLKHHVAHPYQAASSSCSLQSVGCGLVNSKLTVCMRHVFYNGFRSVQCNLSFINLSKQGFLPTSIFNKSLNALLTVDPGISVFIPSVSLILAAHSPYQLLSYLRCRSPVQLLRARCFSQRTLCPKLCLQLQPVCGLTCHSGDLGNTHIV